MNASASRISRRARGQRAARSPIGFAFAGVSLRALAQGAQSAARKLDPSEVDAFLASTPTAP